MWIRYRMSDGIWEINSSNLEFFMRSCAHSHAVLKNSTINTENNLFGPNLSTVDVDWPSVRKDRDERAEAELQEFFNRLDISQGGKIVRDNLINLKAFHDSDERAYLDRVRNAQKDTLDNIDSSVQAGLIAKDVFSSVRDLCATVLLSGATILSGGAILPVLDILAMGGLLKFYGKYQDTGDVNSAAFTAGSEVAMAVIGIKMQGSGQIIRQAVAIGGSTAAAGVGAVIEGKDAVKKMDGKMVGGMADRLVFRDMAGRVFAQSPTGVIISGSISNGTKLLAEGIIDWRNAKPVIDDTKRAPYIAVPEAFIALSPEEQFIENSIMRKVEEHPHCAPIPYLSGDNCYVH